MQESHYRALAECARFEGELGAYLDGEFRPFVLAHQRNCGACNALLADLQSIRQAAAELPLEEPSSMLWAKIRAGLEPMGAVVRGSCIQFGAELPAYMECEDRPFVPAHSQNCPSCGAVLADLQSIQHAARQLPLEEPSSLLWTKVRADLEVLGAFRLAACKQFDAELQAYLEGEPRPFIVTHADQCAPCGALLADLQSIQLAAQDLPQEEPSWMVWANVRAKLEAEGAFARPVSAWHRILAWNSHPHFAPLAVLSALVCLGALLTLPSHGLQPWGSPQTAESSPAALLLASAVPAGVDDTGLAPVVSGLETSFRANEASMTPDLKATYEKSLVSLDGSIRECLDSLQQEPSNALAREYLLTAYTRKAEVLSSALEFEGR